MSDDGDTDNEGGPMNVTAHEEDITGDMESDGTNQRKTTEKEKGKKGKTCEKSKSSENETELQVIPESETPSKMYDMCDVDVSSGAISRPEKQRNKLKRGRGTSDAAEAELLLAMKEALDNANKPEIEDDIDVYVKNLGRKLKKITDKRALLIVQNQLDQAIFRATIGLWDSQDSRMQSQPPNSQIPHQVRIASTPAPQNQNWAYSDNFQEPHCSSVHQSFTSMLSDLDRC